MAFKYDTGNPYNYYPNTSIALCVISYESIDKISNSVSSQTNLNVVWGPKELTDSVTGIAYSLMYVAANASTGEYFVVIRGTNPDSLWSWFEEDFDLSPTPAFGSLPGGPPGVPSDAYISQGTFNGLSYLISMTDPTTGVSVVDFLKNVKPQYVYVTGHSLGGTLTPPLFAYLNAMLYGAGPIHNMAMWSFAGLTPGGAGFNAYLNSVIPNDQRFLWRIQNSLDIAPLMWWSLNGIRTIYSHWNLYWSILERGPLEHYFSIANGTGIGYSQPQVGKLMPGTFDDSFPNDDSWALQAMHQHHATTYQPMVAAQFPLS